MCLTLEESLGHIISIHRRSSDVDGCTTVSDYSAAVRHVSCIYCGECGRTSLCEYIMCLRASASLKVPVGECVLVSD